LQSRGEKLLSRYDRNPDQLDLFAFDLGLDPPSRGSSCLGPLPPPLPPKAPPLQPRPTPYLWVTWLAKYLAGEITCEWSIWVQVHFRDWKALTSGPDYTLARYSVAHTALLRQLAAEYRGLGGPVSLEASNAFHLQLSPGVTLAGKPDLVGAPHGTPRVTDAKSGQPKASHLVQVQIYPWALPRAVPRYQGVAFEGYVAYADGHQEMIPSEAIDDEFEARLLEAVAQLGSDMPPYRAPSPSECRYCPLALGLCPEREDPIVS
jgi:hypothetical protein